MNTSNNEDFEIFLEYVQTSRDEMYFSELASVTLYNHIKNKNMPFSEAYDWDEYANFDEFVSLEQRYELKDIEELCEVAEVINIVDFNGVDTERILVRFCQD